jgi:hypothetical protein
MTEPQAGERTLALIGIGFGHARQSAADADGDQGADLEQLVADGASGCRGELGVAKAEPTKRLDRVLGKRGEPEPELMGFHGGGRGAIGEQIELHFLDPVLPIAAMCAQGRRRPGLQERSSEDPA